MDADQAPPFYNHQQDNNPPPEPPPQQDTSRNDENVAQYNLSVEEASQLFENAGVPRSPRTVIRYCSLKHLECIKIDTLRNEKYLVSESSVRARIEELQQVMATSHVPPRPDVAGHDAPSPDTSRNDDTQYVKQLESRVGELEREKEELILKNRDLEITNRVKDSVIKTGERQLSATRTQLMRFNRAVGELATILRLKAPEHDTSQIIAYIDAPVSENEQSGDSFGDTSP